MSALASIGIKDKDGNWKNYTIEIKDQTDKYGNNVTMFVQQTKEERENKSSRTYIANGKVFWTDGKIAVAEKKVSNGISNDSDLPF